MGKKIVEESEDREHKPSSSNLTLSQKKSKGYQERKLRTEKCLLIERRIYNIRRGNATCFLHLFFFLIDEY